MRIFSNFKMKKKVKSKRHEDCGFYDNGWCDLKDEPVDLDTSVCSEWNKKKEKKNDE